jgi:hypothetical protein
MRVDAESLFVSEQISAYRDHLRHPRRARAGLGHARGLVELGRRVAEQRVRRREVSVQLLDHGVGLLALARPLGVPAILGRWC